jgi:DNA ligase-1
MPGVLLRELVEASEAVRTTSARLGKVERLAEGLARLGPDEVAAGVAFLSGELRQRQTGVGWATLRELPPPAETATLTVGEVDAAFAALAVIAGRGAQAERARAVAALFGRATGAEQEHLRALATGELRQGALAGVMVDAVARAAGIAREPVRRALMLRGDLGAVAAVALGEGVGGLAAIGLEVGRPVQPMLATPAADVAAGLERLGEAAVEWKVDGARIQVHRAGGDVGVFTRSLDDVTARLPEVVEAALALPADAVVLDGEAIALRPDGRPEPFQVTASRFGSRTSVAGLRPLTPLVFDVLHLDGEDLIDRPARERFAVLDGLVPDAGRIPRETVGSEAAAAAFLATALQWGHEGVMLKALDAPYLAGRRGAGWLKVKPRHTLDLVVLAVEWGHGRRRGRLSNLHLGARADQGDGFVMLGKTFKGLTDAMLEWQTERLLALAVARRGHVVEVRPELVIEIAFDGVQTSPRYPGGVALRFARVVRHRPEKRAEEADRLSAVLALHASGNAPPAERA